MALITYFWSSISDLTLLASPFFKKYYSGFPCYSFNVSKVSQNPIFPSSIIIIFLDFNEYNKVCVAIIIVLFLKYPRTSLEKICLPSLEERLANGQSKTYTSHS